MGECKTEHVIKVKGTVFIVSATKRFKTWFLLKSRSSFSPSFQLILFLIWSLLLSPPGIALIKTHKGSLLSASLSFYNLGEQKVPKMAILLPSRARFESGFCCEGGPVTFRKDGQGCQLKRVVEESELIHGSQISCGQFVLWIFVLSFLHRRIVYKSWGRKNTIRCPSPSWYFLMG